MVTVRRAHLPSTQVEVSRSGGGLRPVRCGEEASNFFYKEGHLFRRAFGTSTCFRLAPLGVIGIPIFIQGISDS